MDNNIYRANIGEEFKIDTVSGSADFMPASQGGGRQYHSVGTQNVQPAPRSSTRYVSEEDITIKTR